MLSKRVFLVILEWFSTFKKLHNDNFVVSCVQRYYMTSAREVSRVQGVEKSPIINQYGESIAGAATIRGFGQYHRFIDTNIQLFDKYARPAFLQFALIEWLCFRMELLCTLVFAFSMILVVSLPNKATDPSKFSFKHTFNLEVTGFFLS